MNQQRPRWISPEEYLVLERPAETKSEHVDWLDEDAARGWLRAIKEPHEEYCLEQAAGLAH